MIKGASTYYFMFIPWMLNEGSNPNKRAQLTSSVLIASEDAIMKGVANPPYIDQHLRLPNHYMFPHIIGPYGFVPVPNMNPFLTILLLTHYNQPQNCLVRFMVIVEISFIFSFNSWRDVKFRYIPKCPSLANPNISFQGETSSTFFTFHVLYT